MNRLKRLYNLFFSACNKLVLPEDFYNRILEKLVNFIMSHIVYEMPWEVCVVSIEEAQTFVPWEVQVEYLN